MSTIFTVSWSLSSSLYRKVWSSREVKYCWSWGRGGTPLPVLSPLSVASAPPPLASPPSPTQHRSATLRWPSIFGSHCEHEIVCEGWLNMYWTQIILYKLLFQCSFLFSKISNWFSFPVHLFFFFFFVL